MMHTGQESYRLIPLPAEAQFTPVYALAAEDFDQDGTGFHRREPDARPKQVFTMLVTCTLWVTVMVHGGCCAEVSGFCQREM
jgi:hypothetical protein